MSALVLATQIAMLRYLFDSAPGADVELLPPGYFLAYGVVRLVYGRIRVRGDRAEARSADQELNPIPVFRKIAACL
jgi:hypothetical protein